VKRSKKAGKPIVEESDAPRPISEHGVIGDMRTLALVAKNGTIDYLCWPFFDSPSIFASLLDTEKGGAFELMPQIEDARTIQMYIPGSNLLVTRWLGEKQSAEVLDLMPLPEAKESTSLVRSVTVTRGKVSFRLRCWPRDDYARHNPKITVDGCEAMFKCRDFSLRLSGTVQLTKDSGGVGAEFSLKDGDKAIFVLADGDRKMPDADALDIAVQRTLQYWKHWSRQSNYHGRWRSAVTRSALALKLLTSSEHGSIAAAGTFGLPETAGGKRNWDYRATWIRDASFTVYALMRLGYQGEANAFTRWLGEQTYKSGDARLQVMYKLDGSLMDEEVELDHLSGYGGARPVRIGNNAAGQLQLDIYGELMDSIYLSNKYGEAISHQGWVGVRKIVDLVCKVWQEPDAGIWESRGEMREHLHSRVMCWVAVDRAIRLGDKRSLPAPFERWGKTRNAIAEDIWNSFWNEKLGRFVYTKGGEDIDASMLMMPLVRFVSATDPAWLATLDAIADELADDSFVLRYKAHEGVPGRDGFFAACSFWFVECLARAGRLDEAQISMEKLLLLGNHVQLYGEEFGPRGEFLGNFPQALTHLALISAAVFLDGALDGKYRMWRP
jgi:GH15 family glucan-1,4-alpha-glucosidase